MPVDGWLNPRKSGARGFDGCPDPMMVGDCGEGWNNPDLKPNGEPL
jgi:hypothetical protein